MESLPSYSVAIRTLGGSGSKYEEMIRSLERQTHRPDAIFVYLAEGYPLQDRVGGEQIVRSPKGMVTQRARSYQEVQSEYLLLCDDDILFEPDSVERLFKGLLQHGGDAISANVYHNDRWPLKERLIQAFFHGLYPAAFGKYAFRVRKSGYFSYRRRSRPVMESQCFAGACILLSKAVFFSISLQDECWMDQAAYPLGEDLVFAYKLHRYGYKVLVHSACGISHEDAQSSHESDSYRDYYKSCYLRYLIWYRALWQPSGPLGRTAATFAFYARWVFRYLLAVLSRLSGRNERSDRDMIRALQEARAFVKSPSFTAIPVWKVQR